MDLLSKAYSNASIDDDDDNITTNPPKRARFQTPLTGPTKISTIHCPINEAPIPGGYVSKRQRSALAQVPKQPDPNPLSDPSPVEGSLSESNVPPRILNTLRNRMKGSQTPLSVTLSGHVNAVNTVQWSTTHSHLLASAGMDNTVSIWNVWSRSQKRARLLKSHNAAVKDVKWSPQGLHLLSCGYDCTSRLVDVEKGIDVQVFEEDQIVETVKFCPVNRNLFISGGSKGHLKLWDVRSAQFVHQYVRNLGSILDAEFTIDGKKLITSSDVSKSNLSENSIIVWDVSRQVPLSNQVYAEAYTCPCIRHHPFEQYFVAQSNGNYIAIFSSRPPFKLNKYQRYEGHGVSGFPIKCNFSLDGKTVASGSNDGSIYFYNSKTSKVIKKIKAYAKACIDVVFHPVLPDIIASCSWDGEICVFQQDPRYLV